MDEDRFSVWLSMAARDRSIRSRIPQQFGRDGLWHKGRTVGGFSGVKIGRGSGVGRVLSARAAAGFHRRVFAFTHVIRLPRSLPTDAVCHHLRYLVRSRQAGPGKPLLYGPQSDEADAAAFRRSCRGDRHQFRTVVQADDGCEYEDLRPLVRRLMTQVGRDLRTPLDWVAADHYDTRKPHSHIVIRGVDSHGGDLVIAREYLRNGLQARAAELVALDLGPDQAVEIARRNERHIEITLEGPTVIDRDLVALLDQQGRVYPHHPDRWRQADRMGRLKTLETLGLAHPDNEGRWYVQPDLIARLGEIEWRNRTARSRALTGPAISGDIDGGLIQPGHQRDAIWEIGSDSDQTQQARNVRLEPIDPYFQTLAQSLKTSLPDHREMPMPQRDQELPDRRLGAFHEARSADVADVAPDIAVLPFSRLIRRHLDSLEVPYDPR